MSPTSSSRSVIEEAMRENRMPTPRRDYNIRKKSTVGFIVWPQAGHILPTLSLAKRLSKAGHGVIYFSSSCGSQIVRAQGFDCEVICPEPELLTALPDAARAASMEALVDEFAPKLRVHGVKHLYTDPILFFAAFAGLRCKIDTRFLWTLDPPISSEGHLPFGLSLQQHRSWRTRVAPTLFWKTPLAQSARDLAEAERKGETEMHRLLLRYAGEFNLPLVYSSFGHLPALRGIVAAPSAIFSNQDSSLTYLGLSLDLERQEPTLEFQPAGKSVYCTFGTNFHFYSQAEGVLAQVIAAAAKNPDISFLVQAPASFAPKLDLPSNVQLASAVPTLKVLKTVSAAIIHGGLGGIKECMYFQVPMLVIPFFFDQPANAAMVERRGIGIAMAPEEATAESIQNGLHKLLCRRDYHAALSSLRVKCLAENQEEAWVESLERKSRSSPAFSPAGSV